MYSVSDHGIIISDRVRIEAYAEALRRAIKPGCCVADIGTGSGIFAFLACQAGARRVYAIEPEDSIQLARSIAKENGFADRIEFIQDFSTRVTLPERVDVIVSDMRDILPPYQHHFLALQDARRRFLAPNGILIPQSDTMWAAVAEAPETYSRHIGPWESNPYHLATESARHLVANSWEKARIAAESLLTEPQEWARLDYSTLDRTDVKGSVSWKVKRRGTGHGITVWFDTVLADGVGFSNAPDASPVCYANAFFFWEKAIPLAEGDLVSAEIQADLVGGDYLWQWKTTIQSGNNSHHTISKFDQATFYDRFPSPQVLRKAASDYSPSLSVEGEIYRYALSLMDGRNSVEQIARRLAERFPEQIVNWQDAMTRAGAISCQYGR